MGELTLILVGSRLYVPNVSTSSEVRRSWFRSLLWSLRQERSIPFVIHTVQDPETPARMLILVSHPQTDGFDP